MGRRFGGLAAMTEKDGDPFDDLVLGDDFVLDARVREPSHEARQQRGQRSDDLRRRLEQGAAPSRPRAEVADHVARSLRRGRSAGPRSRPVWLSPVGIAIVFVIVVVVVRSWLGAEDGSSGPLSAGPLSRSSDVDVLVFDGERVEFPTPSPAADAPLGSPPVVPDHPSHRFLNLDPDGEPVTWDPCHPVSLVVDERSMPSGAYGLLEEAVAVVSAATGLALEIEGHTTEQAVANRRPVLDRYGDRWAPVLVSWTEPSQDPGLTGDVSGNASPLAVERRGPPQMYVTGAVHLDAPQLAEVLARPDGVDVVRATIVHELAHLVGLGHTDDPAELMYPEQRTVELGPGDRAGLAHLGRGPCAPEI